MTVRVLSIFEDPAKKRVEFELSNHYEEVKLYLEPGEELSYEFFNEGATPHVPNQVRSLLIENNITDPNDENVTPVTINGTDQTFYVPFGRAVVVTLAAEDESIDITNNSSAGGFFRMVLLP